MPHKKDLLGRRLGARIVFLRTAAGLTQERLAWESGFESKGYISRIESGERLPSISALEALAKRLGVSVRDLFTFPETNEVDEAIDILRQGGVAFAREFIQNHGPKKVAEAGRAQGTKGAKK